LELLGFERCKEKGYGDKVAEMMPSEPSMRTEFLCDDVLGRYQAGQVGWDAAQHIR
jgi:hypothetical protein